METALIIKISKVFLISHHQFLAMPFGLGTAPLEFTQVGKQFKAIAFSLNLRINQYLDDDKSSLIVIFLGFVSNLQK